MTSGAPETWDLKKLLDNWHALLRRMIADGRSDLPFERLLFQSQADAAYSDIVSKWSKMNEDEKRESWNILVGLSEKGKDEMLPICIRCGVCCKKGSPTLIDTDLELIASGQIPLETLLTVRAGEPVHANSADKAYFLPEEKVKIKEKPDSKTCAMYDEATNSCGLHPHKPAQCRAQACWDPTVGSELATARALTRRDILDGAEQLLELLTAHDTRAAAPTFIHSFEQLDTRGEDAMSQLLGILAFDDHVRDFSMKELSIPEEALDFLFGRSLESRVHLFGYHIEHREDGTHVLVPNAPTSKDA